MTESAPRKSAGIKLFAISWIVVSFFAYNSDAQSYQPFPTGPATWHVVRCWYFYPSGWHDEYTLTMDGSDTLHNGELFKKIFISQHHLPGTPYDSVYPTEFFGGLREFNKQIFIYQIWASPDTSVMLIYDFNNTNIGDTIYTNLLAGPGLVGHLITGVDSVIVGSQYHTRLHLQDPYNIYNTEDWIEGVGSSWGLPFASFWAITDNSYDLTCFYESGQVFYENPAPAYSFCSSPLPIIICDSVLTAVKDQEEGVPSFDLFPNPASDILNISTDNSNSEMFRICLYDVYGSLVKSEIMNRIPVQLDISDLSNGIYITEIKTGQWCVVRKLIIQR